MTPCRECMFSTVPCGHHADPSPIHPFQVGPATGEDVRADLVKRLRELADALERGDTHLGDLWA